MDKAPKSLRLHIGLFGRTNVGKSSFLNMVAGQDVAITSPVPGTTTDVVEKTMELLPLGPVVFLDTAGLDDVSALSSLRLKKTNKIFDRSDIILLIAEPNVWTKFEDEVCAQAKKRNIPYIVIVNKIDVTAPSKMFLEGLVKKVSRVVSVSSVQKENRDRFVSALKEQLVTCCSEDFIRPPALLGDLMPKGGTAILIVPIDLEAPKGRIILPQVQAIRDVLDFSGINIIVKETEYLKTLKNLKGSPDIVVCDSQVVDRMVAETPKDVACTTFSILFARLKGDLGEMAKGALAIDNLKNGDKILIAESCSHHAVEDDIGRVKIPRWLKKYTKCDLKIDVCAGRDFPENLKGYKLVILCGSCMLTRRETLSRMYHAKQAGVPVTNYGVAIAFLHGVLERVLSPFPQALKIFSEEKRKK